MEYMGMEIRTEEGVYKPSDDSFLSAQMIAECLPFLDEAKSNVIDVGTGSGILGLVAANFMKKGHIIFLDVDENALKLAAENFDLNRKKLNVVARFIKSDLFSKIPKGMKFGMIIFNAPYLRNEKPDEEMEYNPWSGGTTGIEVSVRFLSEAREHLDDKGIIIINASSLGNLEVLAKNIESMGFKIINRKIIHIFFEDIVSLAIASR
jgi:release factor glutamine methyltransferase